MDEGRGHSCGGWSRSWKMSATSSLLPGGAPVVWVLSSTFTGWKELPACTLPRFRPGDALQPEKHLYEELICVLNGVGATEVWQEGKKKSLFEWGRMSLFSPPLNQLASPDQRRAGAGKIFSRDQRADGPGRLSQSRVRF